MAKKINAVIADRRDVVRAGLVSILLEDGLVAHVYEAVTEEDLHSYLNPAIADFFVINQISASDLQIFPRGQFVVLAREFTIKTFHDVCEYGARAYLLESSPIELIRIALHLSEDDFLLDPSVTPYIIKYLSYDRRFVIDNILLTPREKEIVNLLREGVDRSTIAEQLHISHSTLKTHIKNIIQKRDK